MEYFTGAGIPNPIVAPSKKSLSCVEVSYNAPLFYTDEEGLQNYVGHCIAVFW